MNRQTDRVTLTMQEIAEPGGGGRGHLELAHAGGAVDFRAIGHRLARVEHDHGRDVRLFLVPLDVVAVHAAEDLPVEMAQVVTRHVLTVLDKLDAEPVPRAAVLPRQEAIDDALGDQLEVTESGDEIRVEESVG